MKHYSTGGNTSEHTEGPWDLVIRKADMTFGQGLKGKIGGSGLREKGRASRQKLTCTPQNSEVSGVWGSGDGVQASCPARPGHPAWCQQRPGDRPQLPILRSFSGGPFLCTQKSGLMNYACALRIIFPN